MQGRRVSASPVAPLLAFSAATNLGIAGRTVRIAEDVSEPGPLVALLAGFGARIVDEDAALVLAADVDAAAARASAPAVVVAARPVDVAHPGVERTDRDGVLVVRGLPAAPDPGADRIDRARAWMPVSARAAAALGDRIAGRRVALSMVLEPKTAVLALLLAEAGADVAVFAFASETDDAVADLLRGWGIAVLASSTATPADERTAALRLLDTRPDLLVDDGAHLIRLAHAERPDVVAGLLGATEETTSGVTPLRAMTADGALAVPVIAANDAVTKNWFDNRHGTGETCVLAIVRVLDDDLRGASAAVLGFGPVGEGVAQRLAALGARVTVADTDPRRELAARFAGHGTADVLDAVAGADLVVSATGVPGTVDDAVFAACRPDAAIAVAGGTPEEVLLPAGAVRERIGPHLERVRIGDRTIRLLAGGEAVNIVAGEGNPIDVMDLSFAVQLSAIRTLVDRHADLHPGVHALDEAVDRAVASSALGRDSDARAGASASADWRRTRFDVGGAR